MSDEDRKNEKVIEQLKKLPTAESALALLQDEARNVREEDVLHLVEAEDLWSQRAAAFLAFYQVARNAKRDIGTAFGMAWEQTKEMRITNQLELPRYAAWVAHYEREELVVRRCETCDCLFACTPSNPARDCHIHRKNSD